MEFSEKFNSILETFTEMQSLSVNYGGVAYLKKVNTKINVALDADIANAKYVFKENEFSFNELTLGLDGFVAMLGDDIDMDVKFFDQELRKRTTARS